MEEAVTLMLTHKVCGVRAAVVMQLLDSSVFSKERIEIPVEEAVRHGAYPSKVLPRLNSRKLWRRIFSAAGIWHSLLAPKA
jgi:hypothetical protein